MQFAVLIGHDLSKIHPCPCNPPNSPAGCLRLWCTQEHRAQRARPGLSLHITHSLPQEAWLCTRQWPGAGQATVSTATFGLLLFLSTLSRLVSGCYLNPLGGLHLFHSQHGYGWERLIWSIPGQFDSSCHKDQRPCDPATPLQEFVL